MAACWERQARQESVHFPSQLWIHQKIHHTPSNMRNLSSSQPVQLFRRPGPLGTPQLLLANPASRFTVAHKTQSSLPRPARLPPECWLAIPGSAYPSASQSSPQQSCVTAEILQPGPRHLPDWPHHPRHNILQYPNTRSPGARPVTRWPATRPVQVHQIRGGDPN